jgi:hypothetical protein
MSFMTTAAEVTACAGVCRTWRDVMENACFKVWSRALSTRHLWINLRGLMRTVPKLFVDEQPNAPAPPSGESISEKRLRRFALVVARRCPSALHAFNMSWSSATETRMTHSAHVWCDEMEVAPQGGSGSWGAGAGGTSPGDVAFTFTASRRSFGRHGRLRGAECGVTLPGGKSYVIWQNDRPANAQTEPARAARRRRCNVYWEMGAAQFAEAVAAYYGTGAVAGAMAPIASLAVICAALEAREEQLALELIDALVPKRPGCARVKIVGLALRFGMAGLVKELLPDVVAELGDVRPLSWLSPIFRFGRFRRATCDDDACFTARRLANVSVGELLWLCYPNGAPLLHATRALPGGEGAGIVEATVRDVNEAASLDDDERALSWGQMCGGFVGVDGPSDKT